MERYGNTLTAAAKFAKQEIENDIDKLMAEGVKPLICFIVNYDDYQDLPVAAKESRYAPNGIPIYSSKYIEKGKVAFVDAMSMNAITIEDFRTRILEIPGG